MLKVEEIKSLIDNDYNSERKQHALIGQRYYEGRHDILDYKLYYTNSEGKTVLDNTRSNIKIPHPFFTELVDQCVQYMLSGDESIVKSDDEILQEYLDEYFNADFIDELSDVLTDVCVNGFGNMYAYTNAEGKLQFMYADSIGVVRVRAKDTDDHCEYIIYWYIDRVDKGRKSIKRIQVWDKNLVTYYVQVENGAIELDASEPINPRPHIVFTQDNEEGKFGDSLGFIPFFQMDANRKQIGHLRLVKALIDDYDLMSCGLSNNLEDISEGVFVVKGFEGDSIDDLVQQVRKKKQIGVNENGDLDIKTIDIPYQARQIKLELDEKNIYRFGMGFNSAQLGDGNITNVVIKSRYALLDLKCNKLEKKLRSFMKAIVRVVLDEINEQYNTAYALKDVYFNFTREVMTNASDNAQIEKTEAETKQIKINTVLDLATVLDSESILREVCDILELDYEEIKDKVPKEDTFNLNKASEDLDNLEVDDNGGDLVE